MEDHMQRQTYGHVPRYYDWFKGSWWPLGTKGHREAQPVIIESPAAAAPVQQPGFVSLVYHGMDNPGYGNTNNPNFGWVQRGTEA